jgi:hypothetical protein
MGATMTSPTIQLFDGSGIPDELKAMRRWAPWQAVFNVKRGKYDKLPKSAHHPEYGISTASPEKWFSHDEALTAYIKANRMLAGICFVMTDIEGLVGIDLDNCLDAAGVVAPWAQEVIKTANSYTEISPSGRGLRIFALGLTDGPDWTNNEVGIEVYVGSTPRHLTVSGRVLPGAPTKIAPVTTGFLAGLRGTYGRASSAASLAKKDLPSMPDVLAEADTPALGTIELPPAVLDFLKDGECSGDRSRALHSAAVSVISAGLTMQQSLSVLAHSHHAMEVAMDHRRQDYDRALTYLWEHHCVKAAPKARPKALTAADFDDLSATMDVPVDAEDDGLVAAEGSIADGFDDVSEGVSSVHTPAPKAAVHKFKIYSACDYTTNVRRLSWFVKGVIPKADLVAVFGASGSGKTFITLDIAARVAMGMSWFGIPCKQANVLYIAAEGASGMRERLQAWCLQNGVNIEDTRGKLYILGDQPNLTDKDEVKALVSSVRGQCAGVELVVADTMAQVTPGANENSGEDMGRFLGFCKAIGKALSSTVALVGHSGKDSTRGLRGWSGVKGALDAECEVVRTNDYRALIVTKLKDGNGEGKEYRFTLPEVLLDFDLDDGVVSSCVAIHGEVFNEAGAKDVAQSEQSASKKKAKAEVPKGLKGDRNTEVLNFLVNKAKAEGTSLAYEATVAELVAHLTKDGRDGVGFTSAAVDNKDPTPITRKVLLALAGHRKIEIDGSTIKVLGITVEAPEGGTVGF